MNISQRMCANRAVVYLLSAIAIILWGMSYIWSDRLIALGIPIFYFVPIRICLAGLLLLLFNLATGAFKRIASWPDLLKFLALSLCEPFVYFLCETYGIKETGSPTVSAMIIATVPVFSVGAGYLFFRERTSWLNALGILVTLVGVLFVLHARTLTGSGEHFYLGVALLVGAVLVEVGHATLTKCLTARYKPQVVVMYQFLIGTVYFLPLFLTKGLEGFRPSWIAWEVLGPIVALAALCSSLAFSLWALTIKQLGVAKSSVFLAMMCVATALAAEMLGQEHLGRIQWLGTAVAVVGIVLSQYNKRCGRSR